MYAPFSLKKYTNYSILVKIYPVLAGLYMFINVGKRYSLENKV